MTAMILTLMAVAAGEPCVSGVPVGQRPGPYSFLIATGPDRGKQECYVCAQADKPTVIVFGRALSPATGKLLAAIDAEVIASKDPRLKCWFTQLTDAADLDALGKWSQTHGLKSLTVGACEDADGPPGYKLSPEAEVTVLMFVGRKVVGNVALRADELTAERIAEVRAGVAKISTLK